MKELYDALIVGAGPAGSYIAGKLAAQGHKVIVFEQHKTIGKATCCTGIVGKECLDTFPIGREAILREVKSATFFIPSGESLRLERESTQAYILDRRAFDSAIARMAQVEGAEYLLDTRVKDIILGNDIVHLEAESQGKREVYDGKSVVIASGFGSKLTQSLGLGKCSDFVMGAQAEVKTDDLNDVDVYFGNHIAPGFFAWLVPTLPGKALVGLLARNNTGLYLKNFLFDLFQQGRIVSPEVEIKYGGIPLRPLPKTFRERVLVVGDAAGQVKPTTGGGIYYGLLSAQIAADTLNEVFRSSDFSTRAFKLYETKWRERLSRELKIDYCARWIYERLDDRQVEYVLHLIWSRGIHERLLKSDGFSFDWHSKLFLKGLRYLGMRKVLSILWYLISTRLFGSLWRQTR